ncbi:hypothetical protein D3261_09195 [Halococcus sp. IIIV-5B]|nr:hypothetical protein D3261_09195 [Halococcus sp. IIIV-5B]
MDRGSDPVVEVVEPITVDYCMVGCRQEDVVRLAITSERMDGFALWPGLLHYLSREIVLTSCWSEVSSVIVAVESHAVRTADRTVRFALNGNPDFSHRSLQRWNRWTAPFRSVLMSSIAPPMHEGDDERRKRAGSGFARRF